MGRNIAFGVFTIVAVPLLCLTFIKRGTEPGMQEMVSIQQKQEIEEGRAIMTENIKNKSSW